MRKYLPSKTEQQTLLIGFCLGIIAGTWFAGSWGLFAIIAPLIIVIAIALYLYYKQKHQYETDLLKAKVADEIICKETK